MDEEVDKELIATKAANIQGNLEANGFEILNTLLETDKLDSLFDIPFLLLVDSTDIATYSFVDDEILRILKLCGRVSFIKTFPDINICFNVDVYDINWIDNPKNYITD